MRNRDAYTEIFLKAAGEDYSPESIKAFNAKLWSNPREKELNGLKVSDWGFIWLTTVLELVTHEVNLPSDDILKSSILLYLDRYFDSPYYLQKKKIIVFLDRTAFELFLFAEDLEHYCFAKAVERINRSKKG